MKNYVALSVIVAAAVAAGLVFRLFGGVSYQDNIASVAGTLITSLLVITAFIERSTAVINSIWYGQEKKEAEMVRLRAEQDLIFVRSEIRYSQANPLLQAGMARLDDQEKFVNSTLATSDKGLAAIESAEDTVRTVIGFVIALLVSAAGVRTLESLQKLSLTPKDNPNQLAVYHAIDIVITAGLIAGGTNGIHAIADLISKEIKATALRVRVVK